MTCPLIGQIALTLAPGLALLDDAPAALRVAGFRGHDVILLNPTCSVYDRIATILDLTAADEKQHLVWDVDCACSSAVQLRTA